MEPLKKKKLLLAGTKSIHIQNYLRLIEDSFSEILVVTDQPLETGRHRNVTASMSFKPITAIPSRLHHLRRIIREFNPDILHVHQANTCAAYVLKANNTAAPVIVTAWGSDILYTPQVSLPSRILLQFILKKGDYFTASCQYMADLMKKYRPEMQQEILVANFGIDFDFPELPKEKIIYSNRYLNPHYQIGKIIEGFAEFNRKPENKEWKLIIAADGSERTLLEKQVDQLQLNDSIQFTGWLSPEVNKEYYSKAGLFISYAKTDSTSISLYEAMASGAIPVVTDYPANSEIIEDGKNGVLIHENIAEAIAHGISLCKPEIIAANKVLVKERAGKEANRKKFNDLYLKAIHAE
jgi:L-malate glycosyltransferase